MHTYSVLKPAGDFLRALYSERTDQSETDTINVKFDDRRDIMELCYAAARGNREAKALREKWRRHPRYGKHIADFDAKRLRRDRGQPKGFVHERLSERNDFVITYVEHAQAQFADLGYVHTLSRACWHVDKYFNKKWPYQNRPGDVRYDEKGACFNYDKIRNIMRRHITRRNKIRRPAK
jgi:hypothetical protein